MRCTRRTGNARFTASGGGGRTDSQSVRYVTGFVTVSPGSPGAVTRNAHCRGDLLDTAAPRFLTAWASTTAEHRPAEGRAVGDHWPA